MAVAEEVVIADLDEPSIVYGVHGTEGISQWKCFARRNNLFGPWEAVEWAWLPPGGVSGEHVHSRTEELYFIVSGAGMMTIDGQVYPVSAGDLILTGLGTRHGLWNVGAHELSWLVIEVVGPAMAAALSGQEQAEPGQQAMSNAAVISLREVEEVDARTVLSGPLGRIRLTRLRPGERETLIAGTQEHTLFTLDGKGSAATGSAIVALEYGVAATLPLGSSVTVEAGVQGLELFIASLAVPRAFGDST
jgi:uncharacterized cupin superfamily protein